MSYSTITFTRGDKDLTNLITSICWQSIPPKEVLIVFDGRWQDIDKTKVVNLSNLLEMFGIAFMWFESSEKSFAKMKNKYYYFIDTEFVLYVEDDSLIPQNYAETLLQRMKFSDKISSVGGCQLLTQNFSDIQDAQIFKKQPIPFDEQRYQRLVVKDGLLEYGSIKHQTQLYDSDPSTNLYCDALLHTYMLRMDDLRAVQGWDEEAPENGSLIFEEMDVMYRMNKLLGKTSVIVPNIVMWHFRGDNKRIGDLKERELARLERKKYFGQKYINIGIAKE